MIVLPAESVSNISKTMIFLGNIANKGKIVFYCSTFIILNFRIDSKSLNKKL